MPPFPKLCEPVMILFHVVVPEMHGEVCEPRRACPRDVEVADIPDDRGRVGEPAEVRKFVCDVSVEVRIGGRGSRAEFNMGRKSRARIEADVRQYPPGPPPPLFEDSQNWAWEAPPALESPSQAQVTERNDAIRGIRSARDTEPLPPGSERRQRAYR